MPKAIIIIEYQKQIFLSYKNPSEIIKYVHFQQGRLSAIHGRTATFLIGVEITLRWRLWWFLTLFGSNKSLPLPPVPLIWTPMDLIDLEHAVGGLLKLWEAHKVL